MRLNDFVLFPVVFLSGRRVVFPIMLHFTIVPVLTLKGEVRLLKGTPVIVSAWYPWGNTYIILQPAERYLT